MLSILVIDIYSNDILDLKTKLLLLKKFHLQIKKLCKKVCLKAN